jgi:hypothetical protein
MPYDCGQGLTFIPRPPKALAHGPWQCASCWGRLYKKPQQAIAGGRPYGAGRRLKVKNASFPDAALTEQLNFSRFSVLQPFRSFRCQFVPIVGLLIPIGVTRRFRS